MRSLTTGPGVCGRGRPPGLAARSFQVGGRAGVGWGAGCRCRWWSAGRGEQFGPGCVPGPGRGQVQGDPAGGRRDPRGDGDQFAADGRMVALASPGPVRIATAVAPPRSHDTAHSRYWISTGFTRQEVLSAHANAGLRCRGRRLTVHQVPEGSGEESAPRSSEFPGSVSTDGSRRSALKAKRPR